MQQWWRTSGPSGAVQVAEGPSESDVVGSVKNRKGGGGSVEDRLPSPKYGLIDYGIRKTKENI